MASILDRYGIKEVADVTFYKINKDGTPGAPVLFLDTLKVSTIEQTAENTTARGGKGNPDLIMWDYGKEITVNLEDALFSAKSLAMMYGVDTETDDFGEISELLRTIPIGAVKDYNAEEEKATFVINNQNCSAENVALYNEAGKKVETAEEAKYAIGTIEVIGQKIDISSDKFPGTYYVVGDTYARSETTGQDEFFQFIIPKAKMQSEVTLTMEAEGDPSTFTMNMKVLRPANGEMMKLVKFRIPIVIKNGQFRCESESGSYNGTFKYELNDAGILKVVSVNPSIATLASQPNVANPILQEATEIILENSENSEIVGLGQGACINCKQLVKITIPGSVTSLNSFTFSNSNNLKTIYFPEHSIETAPSLETSPWGAPESVEIIYGIKS